MLRIEQLSADEGPRLRAIRLRALADAPDAFGSMLNETAARPDETWANQVRDIATFVAVMDDHDVGLVRCARDGARPERAWLISMWVAPEVRRTGVGSALVDAAIKWSRSSGIVRLVLDVADHNAPAIALYKMKGFEPTGQISTFPPPREHIQEHRRELRLS